MVNLLCIISSVFAFLGIIGCFFGSQFFLYIGAILNVIEHIAGRISGKLKSLNTLFLSILIAVLFSFFITNPLIDIISYCLCLENIINLIGGIILISYLNNKTSK